MDVDQGMVVERPGDGRGETIAVDASAPPAGTWLAIGGAHDQRAEPAHFGIAAGRLRLLAASSSEMNWRHEFSEAIGAMGFGHPVGTHLVQDNGDARLGHLPGTSEPARPAPMNVHGLGE